MHELCTTFSHNQVTSLFKSWLEPLRRVNKFCNMFKKKSLASGFLFC